jgi:pimeloyl-ACP methyl ester carboxylesterase
MENVSSSEKSTTGRSPPKPPRGMQAIRSGMQLLSHVAPERAAIVAERLFLTPRRYRRPTWEREALTGARSIRLGELAAWVWGEDSAPTVLLVHGWEGRGSQLSSFAAPLVARGLRVVAFDAPAHGDSPGERSSIIRFAAAIAHAAQEFGPLHAVVTHSMGGAATLWAGRHRPVAERLVLISPPKDVRDFTRSFGQMLGLTDDVRERVHQRLSERFGVPVEAFQVSLVAANGKGPLLVIHDEDDHEVPIACGETVVAAWPGARLHRTQGHGHRRILRDPGVVEAVVDFVTSP